VKHIADDHGSGAYAFGMLSRDQIAILESVRSGPDGQGTGSTENELEQQFPDRMHLLRQLDAEGYVEVVTAEPQETTEPQSSGARVYRLTTKGETALRNTST
jgi:hypothetical protein